MSGRVKRIFPVAGGHHQYDHEVFSDKPLTRACGEFGTFRDMDNVDKCYNKKTRQAIQDAMEGRNLTEYKNSSELFDKLGI